LAATQERSGVGQDLQREHAISSDRSLGSRTAREHTLFSISLILLN